MGQRSYPPKLVYQFMLSFFLKKKKEQFTVCVSALYSTTVFHTFRPESVKYNLNYTSAAKRRARIILIIRALEGRNVWTHPCEVILVPPDIFLVLFYFYQSFQYGLCDMSLLGYMRWK